MKYNLDIKSFLVGVIAGVVLTFAGLSVLGLVYNSRTSVSDSDEDKVTEKTEKIESEEETDPIDYLDEPMSYEDKTVAKFKVFQVLGNAALAMESEYNAYDTYLGNTVLLLGKNFYNDQIITVNKPQRIGSYSYTKLGGQPMTVPVIEGETK